MKSINCIWFVEQFERLIAWILIIIISVIVSISVLRVSISVLSHQEANTARPSLREMFKRVDSDGDYNVSFAEYNTATINSTLSDYSRAT